MTKIPITRISEEYQALFLFDATYWFPFGFEIDWEKLEYV